MEKKRLFSGKKWRNLMKKVFLLLQFSPTIQQINLERIEQFGLLLLLLHLVYAIFGIFSKIFKKLQLHAIIDCLKIYSKITVIFMFSNMILSCACIVARCGNSTTRCKFTLEISRIITEITDWY